MLNPNAIVLFAAQIRGEEPVDISALALAVDLPEKLFFLFSMFQDHPPDFHYCIDSIDINIEKLELSKVNSILEYLIQQKKYVLSWGMYDSIFQDPAMLFNTTWEIEGTCAVCFKGEKLIVEMDLARRQTDNWRAIMARATDVIQN